MCTKQGTLSYPPPPVGEEEEEEKPGDTYTGYIARGKRHGKGKYVWSSGAYYDGEYADNLKQGEGIMVFPDKGRYEGKPNAGR